MPTDIKGVKPASFDPTIVVVAPGDPRQSEASVAVPVRKLLGLIMWVNEELKTAVRTLNEHGHSIATDAKAGFMSPGDRQNITGFMEALGSHAHVIATTLAPGFMSKDDKIKLNGVEKEAQKVTTARALEALGVKFARRTLPGSSFAANEVKQFRIALDGVTFDDCVLASQYSSSIAQFGIMYHAADDAVEMLVRNFSSTASRVFPATEVTLMVLKFQPTP